MHTSIIKKILILATLLSVILSPQQYTFALSGSDWQAGNIITDYVFTNSNSLSVEKIQGFLDYKMQHCDSAGALRSEISGGTDYNGDGIVTRAEFGKTYGNNAPFTCINQYYEVPKLTPSPTVPANNYGGKAIPQGAKSIAWIISDAAKRYNISPKVLLVKLGTESTGPLTSDPWPFLNQYTYAMGAHCPDSGPGGSASCDENYAGISIQIYEGAQMMREYLDGMDQAWWPYRKPNQNNHILWNVVERGCGGSDVYIENKATAALYTYTPYQPNAAALSNLNGRGDNCSAYGNRNFWKVFNNWFNSSYEDRDIFFTAMSNRRYMETTAPVRKINVYTGATTGGEIAQGIQIKFTSKSSVQNTPCLRTAHDTSRDAPYCIPIASLAEIDLTPTALAPETYITLTQDAPKYKLASYESVGGAISAFKQIKVGGQVTVADRTFYITARDIEVSNSYGIPATAVTLSTVYTDTTDKHIAVSQDTQKVQPETNTPVAQLDHTLLYKITESKNVNTSTFYRTIEDSQAGIDVAIDSSRATEVSFEPFSSPRWMRIKADTKKLNLYDGQLYGGTLSEGREVFFNSKITINGTTYYRSAHDTNSNTVYVVPSSLVN